MSDWKNKLYYGDNLDIMREYIPDESVDLIYLDPPFNSKATYNVLYKEKNGTDSTAQITAFEDTWCWNIDSEKVYKELVTNCPVKKLSDLIQALRSFLGTNDIMAYLTMMAIRLVEMHRVLKPTGSIYLHCDPTASHYLKLLMDSIFGPRQFRNEIVWCYTRPSNIQRRYPRVHHIMLFYTKGYQWTFIRDAVRIPYHPESDARSLREPGTKSVMGAAGHDRLHPKGKVPEDWWLIPEIQGNAAERLGYPTQKPEALLERIIKASSNEGDIVLDPFCGCGTTISVAEKLHRKWIGIDITHLAISLIKNRLESAYGEELSPYEIIGDPKDLNSARALSEQDKYQFEWWALSLVGARPAQDKKKGADKGIDGIMYFFDDESGQAKKIVVQVKGGHITRNQIATLNSDTDSAKAVIGIFISLNEPTKPMKTEAVGAGFYEAPDGTQYPKLQILTIEELLHGKTIDYPRYKSDVTHKKATRISKQKVEEQTNMDI